MTPRLRDPQSDYQFVRGSRYRFMVISPTFENMRHPDWQRMVWGTAAAVLSRAEVRDVAMVITMAPTEVG